MNTTDATLTNGRYELPAHARGVLVLADPPEAGWRLELRQDPPPSQLKRVPVLAGTEPGNDHRADRDGWHHLHQQGLRTA